MALAFILFSVKSCIFVIDCDFVRWTEWIPRPQTVYLIAGLNLLSQDPDSRLLNEFKSDSDVTWSELVSEVYHAAKLVHSLCVVKEVCVSAIARVLSAD